MFDPVAEQIHRCRDAQSLAECLLHHGLELSRARLGNVQLMNWKLGYLKINAQSAWRRVLEFLQASLCRRRQRMRGSASEGQLDCHRGRNHGPAVCPLL